MQNPGRIAHSRHHVEVLWTDGLKPLPLMQQLRMKARNLCRQNTRHQPWPNEEERPSVDGKQVTGSGGAPGAVRRATERPAKPNWCRRSGLRRKPVVVSPRPLLPGLPSDRLVLSQSKAMGLAVLRLSTLFL